MKRLSLPTGQGFSSILVRECQIDFTRTGIRIWQYSIPLLLSYTASEYETLKAKGVSDDQIATTLEQALMNDSPEMLEKMSQSFVSVSKVTCHIYGIVPTTFHSPAVQSFPHELRPNQIPHPLRSRLLIDYDAQSGHKIINRGVVPPLSRGPSNKDGLKGQTGGPPAAGSTSPKSASEISQIEANFQATVELLRAQQSARLIVAIDGSDVAHQVSM